MLAQSPQMLPIVCSIVRLWVCEGHKLVDSTLVGLTNLELLPRFVLVYYKCVKQLIEMHNKTRKIQYS